jgi:hypothetical protein
MIVIDKKMRSQRPQRKQSGYDLTKMIIRCILAVEWSEIYSPSGAERRLFTIVWMTVHEWLVDAKQQIQ